MTEFFVHTNSFAAPFCSDSDTGFIEGETPEQALQKAVDDYSHPCGLYAAMLYESADAYHKGKKPLLKWLSNHEIAKLEAIPKKGGYVSSVYAAGKFEIDGKMTTVEDPKGGKMVPV